MDRWVTGKGRRNSGLGVVRAKPGAGGSGASRGLGRSGRREGQRNYIAEIVFTGCCLVCVDDVAVFLKATMACSDGHFTILLLKYERCYKSRITGGTQFSGLSRSR